ncbi:PD-(D/E)XK nuclease superfamily protein [Desulfobotulus alkaliphilus]|uniref:PD-(D/E)XK nuclease superfamily protein n=1 Tax=Desulfobotulus alkaliphilus TaxID=622671 RepID=A0A562RHN4_9BACT|nr:PD-(D/E)XK nuclease family protein [Desulfobotulus alkaliphilus]TWI68627.1 PD-(D/E)XK nuclease superfamily protein [Desulfobotulus alkaliphilus]
MNIFKVMASGKKSFQEETASAVLAWFLNPAMEHGLGFTFLSKFINAIAPSEDKAFSIFAGGLKSRMRVEDENQLRFWIDLEYSVDNSFVDIVMGIEDWLFSIENKIYAKSSTDGQLSLQYKGLKNKKDENQKISVIYLVPVSENAEVLDQKIERVFNQLSVDAGDFKTLVTWQKNKMGFPSITDLILEILHEESTGLIDPVSEYTRHTLKALITFIANDFSGYDYKRKNSSGGLNLLTEAKLTLGELKKKESGFVGVQAGLSGLLKMDKSRLETWSFQFTSQNMADKRNWIPLKQFKELANWLLGGEAPDMEWEGRFGVSALYKIALDYGDRVFIGVQGGEQSLKAMDVEIIQDKSWGISMEKTGNNWIAGSVFVAILMEKEFFVNMNS